MRMKENFRHLHILCTQFLTQRIDGEKKEKGRKRKENMRKKEEYERKRKKERKRNKDIREKKEESDVRKEELRNPRKGLIEGER